MAAIAATRAAGQDADRRLVGAVRLAAFAVVPIAAQTAAADAGRFAVEAAVDAAARATILVPTPAAAAAAAESGIVDR